MLPAGGLLSHHPLIPTHTPGQDWASLHTLLWVGTHTRPGWGFSPYFIMGGLLQSIAGDIYISNRDIMANLRTFLSISPQAEFN